jgi:DNA-binding transcriptional MerR regulator
VRIGELAGLVGISTRAIRHYHRIGLLAEPARKPNGYREYSLRDVVELARVRRLTELGLSLDEAGDALADDAGRDLAEILRELDADLARQEEDIRQRRARLAPLLLAGRWQHGVREGDIAVRYASGGAGLLLTLVYLSAIETAVLAFLIPWPLVREITLALDVWGVLFLFGLFASFVVRPHVIGADGSLRLRSGALLDIRVPAQDIAAARVERRTARGKKGAVDDDGCADLAQGGQTTVTVELGRPVTFTRPLGKQARARVFRFYAADPATAVAALRAPELQNVP